MARMPSMRNAFVSLRSYFGGPFLPYTTNGRRWATRASYVLQIVIVASLVRLLINYARVLEAIRAEKAINKVLIIFYVATLLTKPCVVLYTIAYKRNDWFRLLIESKRYERRHGGELNATSTSKTGIFFCLTLMPIVLHLIMGRIRDHTRVFTGLMHTIVAVARVHECFIKFQYFEASYRIAGHYRRLNAILSSVAADGLSIAQRAERVKSVCRNHEELVDLVKRLQTVCMPTLLAIFNENTIRLVVHSYGITVLLLFDEALFHWSVSTFNICNAVIEFCLIIYLTQNCTEQANETQSVLQRIAYNEDAASVRRCLRIFALQLLHDEMRPSVNGFFALDFTILYNVM